MGRWCLPWGGTRCLVPGEGSWRLDIIKPQVKGFMVRPWCWIVERTFAWVNRCRRLGKDYERKVQTSEHLIQIAMIRLMVRRLVQ